MRIKLSEKYINEREQICDKIINIITPTKKKNETNFL